MEDVQRHSVHTLVFRSLKRSHDMFVSNQAMLPEVDDNLERIKKSIKARDGYGLVFDRVKKANATRQRQQMDAPVSVETPTTETEEPQNAVQPYEPQKSLVPIAAHPSHTSNVTSNLQLIPKKAPTIPKPKWHAPWKLYRVISGHLGWVRCAAVEPGNEWFATGAADGVIKIWDLASGKLKLSLTGHVSTVRGLEVSPTHPYLFSCGEDRQVKCWDLEYNKVIRHYHGHLSAVYSLALHPTIDVLITAGRDSTARVWDMRTKANIHTLTGHTNTIASVVSQASNPQIITGSHDSTVRLWDLAAGKSVCTLTNHKKSVRSVVLHPTLYMFASASPDNIKQWTCPEGKFVQNISGITFLIFFPLVGSLTIGTTFFLSPVSGILTDKIGLKTTTLIGGVLMTTGMILSSVFYHNIYCLCFTYGIMYGLGAALAYTPTIAILGHYFKRYLGFVSGFVTCGSSLFPIILPKVLTWLLDDYGLQGTFLILGISSTVVILCSLVYKPLQQPPPPPKRKPGQSKMSTIKMHLKSLVHVENFKRKRYIIWALSMPIALLGYFVPYVHMPSYIQKTFPDSDKSLPIMCIGLTSGIGRLFFGYIADYKWGNRIFLQQISFVLMGLFTIAIPLVDSFSLVLVIALGMGIVDGCFIAVLGPIAYDLCGSKGAAQAIGFLLGLCSIPLTIGAPIAGFLYDETESYRMSFILAGIPALIGATLMTLIRCLRDERVDACDKQAEDQIHKLLNKPAWTEDITIDIKEKNCNTYTFQKVSAGQPKAVLAPETTEFQIDGQDTNL